MDLFEFAYYLFMQKQRNVLELALYKRSTKRGGELASGTYFQAPNQSINSGSAKQSHCGGVSTGILSNGHKGATTLAAKRACEEEKMALLRTKSHRFVNTYV